MKANNFSKDFYTYFQLGLNSAKMKMYAESVEYFEKSVELNPQSLEALINLATSYSEIGENTKAERCLVLALAMKPNNEDSLVNLAKIFQFQGKNKEAAECFYQLTTSHPLSKKTWQSFGDFLRSIGKSEASIKCYKKIISIDAKDVDAYVSLANTYKSLRNYEAVVDTYKLLKTINPDHPFLEGYLFHYKMMACDWTNYDEHIELIKDGIANSLPVAEPFGSQAFLFSEVELKKVAKIFCSKTHPVISCDGNKKNKSNKKIKIAYLCGEFRYQATSILLVGVIENHNKELFEVIALDNGYDDGSDIRSRLNKSFDEIVDISKKGDYEIAEIIKKKNIDVLINLNGYFGLGRPNVFAMKPAQILINFLGFPGTIGADYIDYIIADKITIPESSKQNYCEKVLYLNRPYQCNDNKRKKPERKFTRTDLGLPENSFVYCCFNNNYKITPSMFDLWLKILTSVPDSVLWLIEDNPSVSKNLRKYAKSKNFDDSRLIFAPRFNLDDHLSRHTCADLFLDTSPYNAHTTASDALWAGLPILTLRGTTFPGRVGESLLNSLGLSELVAESQNDYTQKAVYFAQNKNVLDELKIKLTTSLNTSKLYDTEGFTKEYEELLKQIVSSKS